MAKIYQFPQGEERGKFRKEIARERKKRFAVNTGSIFVKWLGWGWFYLRLLAASVLHFVSVFVLAILVRLNGLCSGWGGFCVSSPGIISITSYGRHKI